VPKLVVDSCGLLHAKQLSALSLLDTCIVRGAWTVTSSKAVYGEQVEMTLSSWLSSHDVRPEKVRRTRAIAVQGRCRKNHIAGRKDCGVVALAKDEWAVLWTHDEAAGLVANRLKVVTVDICDIGDFAEHNGWLAWSQIENTLAGLQNFAWRPDDWKGGVESTVKARSYRDKLLHRMTDWQGPSRSEEASAEPDSLS